MTQTSTVISQVTSQNNNHPEYQKGIDAFDAIKSYLIENNIGFEQQSKKCVSVANTQGQKIFIRFYFNKLGMGWASKPAYSVGVYGERKTSVAKMFKGKALLINTNRGLNGFEDHFTQFMSEFSGRSLKQLKLNP